MKIIFIIFFIFHLSLVSLDNPRGRDSGGKLKDLENADGDSDDFWIFLLVELMLSAPEIFFGSSSYYYYSDFPYKYDKGLFDENGSKKWHIGSNVYVSQDLTAVSGLNLDLDIFPSRFWSIKLKHNRFSERFRFEENLLNFTQVFLRYNRVRLEKVNMQWGVGLLNMAGEESSNGFGIDCGIEWFFYKPVSLEVDYSFGSLREILFHDFDVKFNLYRERYNGFAGYKYIELGNTNINNIFIGFGFNL